MANAVYPKFKTARGTGATNSDLDTNTAQDGVYVGLYDVGAGGAYDAADEFYSDISAGLVGTPQRIVNNTFGTVSQGTLDGDNVTFTSVSGASCEAIIIWRQNSGANTTWRLVAYLDTGITGLPVTPNGGNISITWDAAGILTT